MTEMERVFKMTPAYDKRAEGYGQGCATMWFYVIGPQGAVQFSCMTGWYPNVIAKTKWDDWSDWATLKISDPERHDKPLPSDLGYHSQTPRYDGQTLQTNNCHILNGPCYYDGSSLNAMKPFSILVHEGSDKLWEFLETYYRNTFEKEVPNEPKITR